MRDDEKHHEITAGNELQIEALKKGSADIWREVLTQYGSGLLGYAIRMLGDKSTAEDVVQDALVNIVLRTGEGSANDGLVMDEKGRVYIASNKAGKIWRYDPKTKETVLIMQGVVGIASMAFGAGAWDATSIYATSTFNPDHAKRVWRIPVGVKGAKIYYGNE